MLYLVSTPIGNLGDITLRAIEVLKTADLILCEDTRHSLHLLHTYDIRRPLQSYHKFNEREKTEEVLGLLKSGKTVCLISDAGTPLISDPGHPLVSACIEANIQVTSLPGACALIHALVCSGLEFERFQFVGFLPKKDRELRALLNDLLHYPGISIGYESPNRLLDTLNILVELAPSIRLCIGRELTKKFETILRGTPLELAKHLSANPPKGECVLLLEGAKEIVDYSALSIEEHVESVMKTYQVSKREAVKIVADQRHLNKRELYQSFHQREDSK